MIQKKQTVKSQEEVSTSTQPSFEPPLISPVDLLPTESKTKKLLLAGLVVILIGSLIGGGILVSKQALQRRNQAGKEPAAAAPPTLATAKEISPTPSLDKKELKIKVLNGRGEPGVASVAAKLLQNKGYREDIETGNAKNYNYEQTEIQIKADKADYFALLVDDLKDEYGVSSKSAELDENSDFDAIIIIGSE